MTQILARRPGRGRSPEAEKDVQLDVKRLYQQIGGIVWDTSQPFAAAITPGLPDLFIAVPRRAVTFFHEVKAAAGKLTAAQEAFAETVTGCGVRVIVGGVAEAIEWLYELGILMRPNQRDLVPIFPGSQVGWIPNPTTGCSDWVGAVAWNGYGIVGVPGERRTCTAHRLLYERERGPVPEGKELDHLCRNRRCVNPAHLEIVTRRTNSHRGQKTKLSRALIERIRAAYHAGGITLRSLAAQYGVSHAHLSRVLRGERGYWREDATPGQSRA